MTIDELAEKLDMEISARKLLERKLTAQSNAIASTEERLYTQITAATSSLEERMKNAESLIDNESIQRTDVDDRISSSVSVNTNAIAEEVNARADADADLRQQIKANASTLSLLESQLSTCQENINDNTTNIAKEFHDRLDGQSSLSSDIQAVHDDFDERISNMQNALNEMTLKTSDLSKKMEIESGICEQMSNKAQLNSENIAAANQNIDGMKDEIQQMSKKFVDDATVSNMINESFTETFASQLENINEVLSAERKIRDSDYAEVQKLVEDAQSTNQQVLDSLAKFKQSSMEANLDMRKAFNLLLPKGTILPYRGAIADIPDGWQVCNGAKGTPDLVGKVLVGAHAIADSGSKFILGKEGGKEKVALTLDNLPLQGRTIDSDAIDSDEESFQSRDNFAVLAGQESDKVVQAHDNMQPYYCIYYIMKMF